MIRNCLSTPDAYMQRVGLRQVSIELCCFQMQLRAYFGYAYVDELKRLYTQYTGTSIP